MAKKTMTRRDLAKAAAATGLVLSAAQPLAAAEYSTRGGTAPKRFGGNVIPPAEEGREKHAPHITAPAKATAGVPFTVEVIVGKEKRHPNTGGHHIKWLQLFAKEDGEKPMVHVATFDLGPAYAEPKVTVPVILEKTSALYVLAYCNLHGVWDTTAVVRV
jgi:superoxide reductase